jgi:hypothetical protein
MIAARRQGHVASSNNIGNYNCIISGIVAYSLGTRANTIAI